ncbi:MAG: stage V sporulation protein D [Firmicutes bacterium]|nr:stage V sporulation protein D [Bacillota bacterium]
MICAIAFLFLAVLGRLLYVQVIWGENLQEKAVDQWTREIPVVAERGKIVDRNGIVLADNDDTYSIFVRKRAVSSIEEVSRGLSEALDLPYESVYQRLSESKSSEVTVKKQVGKEALNKLLEYGFEGVYYARDNSRVYPYGEFLTQVLGFTSADGQGQSGLELYYNKYLQGINGEILYETDIVGVEIEGSTPTYIPATDGLNAKLTIDYEVQQAAEAAMERAYQTHSPKSARAIVMNPQTGEILAMANKPSFDLNEIPRDDLDALHALSRNGLISDVYEPGSTFKVLTAAANIEEYLQGNRNAFSPEHIFSSSRYRYVDGQRVKCWSDHANGKHSNETLADALNNSCNPVFVDIALALGKEKMYEYIEKFNYGSVTGVDFSGEAQGMVLPASAIQNVDLARIGFGQTIAVTALQLAAATSAAINGGYYYTPYFVSELYTSDHLVAEIRNPKLKNRVISEKASELLREMLEAVVRDGGGKQAYIEGYRVGGKTGTAQKYEDGHIAQGKYVSSFVGFFPANDPQYLALIVIDEPVGQYYGSTVAAPYGKEIFEKIIQAKNIKPVEG